MIILLFIACCFAFDILPNTTYAKMQIYYPCFENTENDNIKIRSVFNEINKLNYLQIFLSSIQIAKPAPDYIHSICVGNYSEVARTESTFRDNFIPEADIYLSDKLRKTPNLFHPVCGHEVLHSFGIQHSLSNGWMKFGVKQTEDGKLIEIPTDHLWLSNDDISAIKYIYLYRSI